MSISTTNSNWLTTIGYPSDGVGDLDDLKLVLGVGDQGRWYGYVKPGWFYSNNTENYNYTSKQTLQATISSASGTITSTSFRPAWGPVLVYGSDGTQYTEHRNCYYPSESLTWNWSAPQIFSATLPTSGILVDVRSDNQLTYARVSSSGDLFSGRVFYQDNDRLYLFSTAASSIHVNVDVAYIKPTIKFREVVVEEQGYPNGLVHSSYKNIKNLRISYRGNYQDLGDFTDGVIYHYLSAQKGDWLTLEYYIDKSYTLVNHNTIQVYTSSSSGDIITVNYEGSPPEYLQTATQTYVNAGANLQFNPLFSDSFRTGFLYHTSGIVTYTPTHLYTYFDKEEIVKEWKECTKGLITVTDKNGIPVPQYAVTLTHNQTTSGMVFLNPAATTTTQSSTGVTYSILTDNKGEINLLLYASSASSGFLTYNVSCGNLSTSGTISILNSVQALSPTNYSKGFTHITQDPSYTHRGFNKLYGVATLADGIPNPVSYLTVISEKFSSFEYVDTNGVSNLYVSSAFPVVNASVLNPGCVAGFNEDFGIAVAGSDKIYGINPNGGVSKITTIKEDL